MPTLIIENTGLVKGGSAYYEIRPYAGIYYDVEIKVKKGWFSKTVKKMGLYKMNTTKLKSTHYDEKNEAMYLANDTYVKVTASAGGISLVQIISKKLTGDAELDVTKSLISCRRINLYAKYLGMLFNIKAYLP